MSIVGVGEGEGGGAAPLMEVGGWKQARQCSRWRTKDVEMLSKGKL